MKRVALAGLALLAGCAGIDTSARARDRAVEVLACQDVEMTQLEEYRFHASGCGRQADIGCTAGSFEPTCIRVASAGDERPIDRSDDDAPIPPPPSATSTPTETTAEGAIRAGLDARRTDVFACTQRDPTVVRVSYTSDGTIDVRLGGGLEGTPEEGCVRAALAGARAPEGASGTVLHLVHGS